MPRKISMLGSAVMADRTGLEYFPSLSMPGLRRSVSFGINNLRKLTGRSNGAKGPLLDRMLDKRTDWRTYYKGFVAGVFVASCWSIINMVWSQDIYTKNLPPEAVSFIQYSADQWYVRSGIDVRLIGETDQWCLEDAIVYRRADFQEWENNGLPVFGGWDALTAKCYKGSGYVILWNPVSKITRSLVLHETGHALGFWGHLADKHSTMYPIAGSNGLTTSDVLGVLDSPFWPIYREPELCFAELLPNFNLYIPDIEGHRVRLDYLGNASGLHRWAVGTLELNPDSQDCAGSYRREDGSVWLDDVRGEAGRWEATLEPVDGGYALVGVTEK